MNWIWDGDTGTGVRDAHAQCEASVKIINGDVDKERLVKVVFFRHTRSRGTG